MLLRLVIPAALSLALAACGTPVDLPLPTKPSLEGSLGSLHREGINAAAPFTVTQVALLAVQNNPDLRAAAFSAGNLDERSYVDLVAARLTKEQEVITIEQSLLDQQLAIATLIGDGMPAIAIPSGETSR
jgi:hypothetical protein